jgi:hypothetical protein
MSSLRDAIVVLLSSGKAASSWTTTHREGLVGVKIEAAYSLVPEQTVTRRTDTPDEQRARRALDLAWQAFLARRDDYELPPARRSAASRLLEERTAALHAAYRSLQAVPSTWSSDGTPAHARG